MIYLAVPVPDDISNFAYVLKKSCVALESLIVGFELSMPQPSSAVCGEMAAGSHSTSIMGNKKYLSASRPLVLSSPMIKKPRAWVALKK